jgi:hypothetical protein
MHGMLERSHWLRNTPPDGDYYARHSKYFPLFNVTAFIQYTGQSAFEQQELEAVYFVPGHAKPAMCREHEDRLKINQVDPLVLSEVLRFANALVSKAE